MADLNRSSRSLPLAIRLLAGCACCLALLAGGCGYQQSNNPDSPQTKGYQWRSLYRQDIQTVAVPIFTNKSFDQGVEFTLTKALVSQIESRTPYKVVPRDRADTILEGEIVGVKTNTLSQGSANSLPQEQILTFNINFTWKNLSTGKILTQRRNFEQTSVFYPTLGEGMFTGNQQAIEKLAAAITTEMQADW